MAAVQNGVVQNVKHLKLNDQNFLLFESPDYSGHRESAQFGLDLILLSFQ